MPNDVDALIAWASDPKRFDPEKQMWDYVNSLGWEMMSEDPEHRASVEAEVSTMLGWLTQPRTPAEAAAAISQLRENWRRNLGEHDFPKHMIEAAVKTVKIRGRGRPRTRNFDAIAGLRMYWLELKPWRQIVLELDGSCKERSCKSYCPKCEDVKRKTKAGRLNGRRPAAKCVKCHFRFRPPDQKDLVCWKCSDAMADLVRRLEGFLADCDIRPPRSASDQLRDN
jgi:hypothetical protein